MGLFDSISAFFATEAYAEEPAEDQPEEEQPEEGKEEGSDEAEGEAEEEEEEEEEEDEEEPVDPKEEIEAACAKTAACRHSVEEYEHCVARVTSQNDDGDHKGPKEDCVEEFFHMTHCIGQCAAPKLFKQLK